LKSPLGAAPFDREVRKGAALEFDVYSVKQNSPAYPIYASSSNPFFATELAVSKKLRGNVSPAVPIGLPSK
jgi:hypothetical protein